MKTTNKFMKTSLLVFPTSLKGITLYNNCSSSCCGHNKDNEVTLHKLPYAYDALEPYIDAETVSIHHDKHHATYVNNFNNAISGFPELKGEKICTILKELDKVPVEIRTAVRNQGGGVFNHNFYWKILDKDNKGALPSGELAQSIDKHFKSFSQFQEQLSKVAISVFGSGWAWLTLCKNGSLQIESTPNQDTPLSAGRLPLLTIDVWEHAYYLKYQNRRVDYVKGIWNLFNWDFISERYSRLIKSI